MLVDINDVRAEFERSRREIKEEFDEESDGFVMTFLLGMLSGYGRVEMLLDELEKDYRNQGLDRIKGLREE